MRGDVDAAMRVARRDEKMLVVVVVVVVVLLLMLDRPSYKISKTCVKKSGTWIVHLARRSK